MILGLLRLQRETIDIQTVCGICLHAHIVQKDNTLRFYMDGCFVSNITDKNKGFVKGRDSLVHNGNEHWVFEREASI